MAKNNSYWVYLLLCKNGSIYTGITDDVEKRFMLHKDGRGARYTRAFGAVKILYTEKKRSKGNALKREYEIKKLSAREKWELVNGESNGKT